MSTHQTGTRKEWLEARLALLARDDHLVHSAASEKGAPLSFAAAYWIALTMFW